MLGKVARWLRLLGHDTLLFRREPVGLIIGLSAAEGRVLLTRDHRMATRKGIGRVLVLDRSEPGEQLGEVAKAHGLVIDPERVGTRCLECNKALETVTKEEIADLVPPFVLASQERFRRCSACNRVFWQGTHVEQMLATIRGVLPG